MSQGWARVSGRLLNSSRPFFVYSWKAALLVDFKISLWMVGCPLSVGVMLACLPFKTEIEGTGPVDHSLYAYVGMGLLGFQTGEIHFMDWNLEWTCRTVCQCLDWILLLRPYERHELSLQCSHGSLHQHWPLLCSHLHLLPFLQHAGLRHAPIDCLCQRPFTNRCVFEDAGCLGLSAGLSSYASKTETEIRCQEGHRQLPTDSRFLHACIRGQSLTGAEFWPKRHYISGRIERDLSTVGQ